MAPQRLEKIESASGNGMGSVASNLQDLVHGRAADRAGLRFRSRENEQSCKVAEKGAQRFEIARCRTEIGACAPPIRTLRENTAFAANSGAGGQGGAPRRRAHLPELLEFADHALDQRQSDAPEAGISGVEAERLEQLRIRLGAAGRQQREVALRETLVRALINAVERIDEAIAEGIGVDIERRMDEVADIGPIVLIAGPEF